MATTTDTTTDWRNAATVTIDEAAPILRVSRSSAYAAARAGELPTIRVGRRLLVPTVPFRRMLGELAE